MEIDFEKGDGLVPVIVQDVHTKQVLMLAYMSKESLAITLESGYATYYSRSRKQLWKKGETSGHVQKVKEMYIDCDQDTLLLLVEQKGAACHSGNYSFIDASRRIIMNELAVLYDTILQRKANPEAGSYTTYLFEKGLEKILKKVGEESSEVLIAALTQSKTDQINELGDLFYHLMVLMVEKGITLEEVNAELTRRSQKTHNKKAERKPIEQL